MDVTETSLNKKNVLQLLYIYTVHTVCVCTEKTSFPSGVFFSDSSNFPKGRNT